jgi:hypothetical protein
LPPLVHLDPSLAKAKPFGAGAQPVAEAKHNKWFKLVICQFNTSCM